MINGIKVKRIINEPSAAALTSEFYLNNKSLTNLPLNGMDKVKFLDENDNMDSAPEPTDEMKGKEEESTIKKRTPKNRNILIFDLGGGTFDVSLVNITENMFETAIQADAKQLFYTKYALQQEAAGDENIIRRSGCAAEKGLCQCRQV